MDKTLALSKNSIVSWVCKSVFFILKDEVMMQKFVNLTILCMAISCAHAQQSIPLIEAVKDNNLDSIKSLIKDGTDVNAYDQDGATALHWAVEQDNVDAVKTLLDAKGVHVNNITFGAQSALDLAKTPEIQELLAAHGGMHFLPIWKRLLIFLNGVNEGNLEKINEMVKNKELAAEIAKVVDGGFNYQFTIDKDTIQFDGPNKVKLDGVFKASKKSAESKGNTASSSSWSLEGFATYYVLEKQGDQWFITDTDFPSKLSFKYFWGFLLGILLLVGLATGFWLWMLIDCITHKVNHKTLWIICLIIFNVFAAIAYYFAVKRKR